MNLIYVKETDIPKTKTRKAFIKRFLVEGGYITYSNPECTDVQCDKASAYRSVTELHAIACSRFKSTSLKAIVRIINEIIEEEANIVLVWCTQIEKVVVRRVRNTPKQYISNYSQNNYYDYKGVDGFSLKDFDEIRNSI